MAKLFDGVRAARTMKVLKAKLITLEEKTMKKTAARRMKKLQKFC